MMDTLCQEVLGLVEAFHVEMLADHQALWPAQHDPSTEEDPGHKAQSYGNKPINCGSLTKDFPAEPQLAPEAIIKLYKLAKEMMRLHPLDGWLRPAQYTHNFISALNKEPFFIPG